MMAYKEKSFLITAPADDDATFYCSEWSVEIIEEAENRGFEVIMLRKEKANGRELESRLEKQNPCFVMFNGHGEKDRIFGHAGETLLEKGKNEAKMNGKLIYARTCFSLDGLGKACAEAGAQAFVGYSLPFMFISDPNSGAHPLKDRLAEPCFTASNVVPYSLLKEQEVCEAVEKSKKQSEELRVFWETREDCIEAPLVAACLYWNGMALGKFGEGGV